jgi:hypothetical protein
MANRTVLVDNNTWNNTHIATVGRAMASPEKQAWEIYRALDVTHVLVIFGGFIGWAPRSLLQWNKDSWHIPITLVIPCSTQCATKISVGLQSKGSPPTIVCDVVGQVS